MLRITQQRSGVAFSTQLVAVIAFDVKRRTSKKSAVHERAHATAHVAKLVVMPRNDLPSLLVRNGNQFARLGATHRKWLLDVYVAVVFEALSGKCEMRLR